MPRTWEHQRMNDPARITWGADFLTPTGAASVSPIHSIVQAIARRDAADELAQVADPIIDGALHVAFAIGTTRYATERDELVASIRAAINAGYMVEIAHNQSERTSERRLHDLIRVTIRDTEAGRSRWGAVPRMSRRDAVQVMQLMRNAIQGVTA